jgi:hypothetical protein
LGEGYVLVVVNSVAEGVLDPLRNSLSVRTELLGRGLTLLTKLMAFELNLVSLLRTSKVCRRRLAILVSHQIC